MPVRPPTHRPHGEQTDAERRADNDLRRGSARSRGYDAAWERFRRVILANHPCCSVPGCTETDRLNVDHIVPICDAPERRLDATNVRVLCPSHHSARTSRDHSWNRSR